MLYSSNTNISGNIIKDDLRLQWTNKTLLYKKNISLTLYSRKGWRFCGVWEKGGETYILRERTSSRIFFQEPGGANACTPLQARQRRLWSAGCPTLDCDSLHCTNLAVWFSSHGLLSVTHLSYPTALIMLSCLLITTWQLVKAHGVT